MHGNRFHLKASLALLLGLGLNGFGLEVREVLWGFENLQKVGAFNLVSVLLDNPSPAPFDGTVRLQRASGIGRSGAPHEAPVYLTPGSQRWVQFLVYVPNALQEWEIIAPDDTGKARATPITVKEEARPARVFLHARRDTSLFTPVMPVFPAEAFPASAASLDMLEALVVDRLPDWEPARRQALRDWVYLGGVLVVLRDQEGERPAFAHELAFAATPGPFGRGQVLHPDLTRRQCKRNTLDTLLGTYPERESEYYGHSQSADTQILSLMVRRIKPKHNWALINVLLIAYLLWVGPLNYRLVKTNRLDYRFAILFFIGSVVVFSLLFYQIGIRGYSMPSLAETLTVARPLENDRVEARQYSNLFSRKSIRLDIPALSENGHLDVIADEESIRGVIRESPGASFQIQMPVNTTMPFMQRGTLAMNAPRVDAADENAVTFALPENITPLAAWTVDNAAIRALKGKGDTWKKDPDQTRAIRHQLEDSGYGYRYSYYYGNNAGTFRELLSECCIRFIVNKHALFEDDREFVKKLPPHARQSFHYLLASTDAPPRIDHPHFKQQESYVLFELAPPN